MKIIVLGNGPSLKTVNLEEIFKSNDIIIGCNHIYKSGFLPHFLCIHDVNFFNHCELSPEQLFSFPCTFVLNKWILTVKPVKDALEKIKPKIIIVEPKSESLVEKKKFAPFPKTYLSHGTITSESIPLAFHILKKSPDKNNQIKLLGVDNSEERTHFYEERKPDNELLDKLGIKKEGYEFNYSHSPELKSAIRNDYKVIRKIMKKHNITFD